jgi:hypothetical protein
VSAGRFNERQLHMKRSIMALMAGALVAAVAVSAATLIVGGGVIQAGTDGDLTCDDQVDVLGWGFESDDGLVYFVRIGDVDPACDGATMFVQVHDNGGLLLADGEASLDSTTVPPGGYSISLDTPTPPQNIGSVTVVIEGGE